MKKYFVGIILVFSLVLLPQIVSAQTLQTASSSVSNDFNTQIAHLFAQLEDLQIKLIQYRAKFLKIPLPAPTVASLSGGSGFASSVVTITGSGFDAYSAISLSGFADPNFIDAKGEPVLGYDISLAPTSIATDKTQLTFTIPKGLANGTYSISVTDTRLNTNSNTSQFKVVSPTLTIQL